ncbi:hypothetical protein AB0I84_04000 [Streptomyces spectabilis]|uniref:Secreted protein n=1 Tax=Streptomyces spectabilis TaxID=68270 RepID=A0A516R822_STRST|nr:hypothetical protein [Streptomyces spectabilis]MBB5106371.1 hypothetical protein [Streptomyces spectabilis]MCI3902981.1 hypothetical protein [Streptomyces spectabilis]QDQ11785.1 hypothetical protein FH965_15410 [Streptomyces spectabilis]QEV60244.1 hypothetical protein CP982_17180 [Streptomyces spectabilis]GGV33099.1 hypothetical protein GCM10010245_53430 [Streptomyces spectabilis]
MAVRHRRVTVAITTALIAVPATLGLVACDPKDAVDCVKAADAVSDGADALRQAAQDAVLYPDRKSEKRFDKIRGDLDDIRRDHEDDEDISEAVDEMQKAVDNVEKAVDNGDKTPDLRPMANAAGKVTKACTS